MTQNCEKSGGSELGFGGFILGVIRGDLSLNVLSQIGIEITVKNGYYKLKSGEFDVSVSPALSDIAMGILKYESRNRDERRKWAFFILGECGAIDLSEIEADDDGQLLIDALWDCSFHGVLGSEMVALAKKLVQECAPRDRKEALADRS